jgi:hypothetical protein
MKLFEVQDSSSLLGWMELSDFFWKPENSPYFWVQNPSKECMKLSKPSNKSYNVALNSCSQNMHFICEYNRSCGEGSATYQESEVENN